MGLKEDILSRINVEQYYSSRIQIVEKRQGKQLRALCPFHSEKDGSFFVEQSTGNWYCHGACKTGDNLISFHMRFHNQDFNQAIRELASIAGIDIPESPKKKKKGEGKGRPSVFPELSEDQVAKMHADLPEAERGYLRGRGISDEVINSLQVGYWIDPYKNDTLVFPVRKNGRLHNLRFYRKATDRREKDIKQLSKKILGHDPIWIFPEPDPEQEEVYVFEGEIDAMCALSLGLNATTATGGAGTWREDFNEHFKDKHVFVCYDIDSAGRIGSKAVGSYISKVAAEVKTVFLDLDPEKYPKGDFNDYVVHEHKTLDNFLALANNSPVVPVLDPGIEVAIVEDEGMYYSTKTNSKGDPILSRITNFTFRLVCRYIMEEEDSISGWSVIREVRLANTRGDVSDSAMLDPDAIANATKFRSFCVGRGNYFFEGKQEDIPGIMHLLEAQDRSAKVVREISQVGESRKHKLWIFDNIVIKNNDIIYPDDRSVFWNGKNGYRLSPFTMGGSASRGPDFVPGASADKNYIAEFCRYLLDNLGGSNYDALLGVGLAVGSIYSRDIMFDPRFACFPITFVYGTHTSGKTEYASFLMRMYGMSRTDSESMPALTSTVPVSRRLSYFSNIPIWIDEYRDNTNKASAICGVLRNAYDGIGRSLGRKKFGVEKNEIRASVIVSGEHLPSDEAFRSRLVPICMNLHKRRPEFHKDVLAYSRKSSENVFELMKTKNEKKKEELFESIGHYIDVLKSSYPSVNQRTIKNYAIALACYSVLANPGDSTLESYITKVGMNSLSIEDQDVGEDVYLTNSMKEFFDIVQMAIESGELNKIGWGRVINDKDKSSVYIHLKSLHSAYAKRYRMEKNETAPSVETVKSWLMTLPCFLKSGSVQRLRTRENNLTAAKKCIELDISRLPPHVGLIFTNMPKVTGEVLYYEEEMAESNELPF